jgi:hypothetical protein
MADLRPLIYKQYNHSRRKQWQTTPKNLPRMQRSRGIPVAWLGSGSCQNRPKDWIQINQPIITVFIYTRTFVPQDLKFNLLLTVKQTDNLSLPETEPRFVGHVRQWVCATTNQAASCALSLSLWNQQRTTVCLQRHRGQGPHCGSVEPTNYDDLMTIYISNQRDVTVSRFLF